MMNRNKQFILIGLFVLIGLSFSAYAQYLEPPEKCNYDITLKGIELREGVTSDIHLKAFVNENNPSSDKIIFAVPGWTHTANTWKPFSEALFDVKDVSKVIAIDMPGQGESTLSPTNKFGDLTLDDYTKATLSSLEHLNSLNIRPKIIIGHSQGGLIVQMMQQYLKEEGGLEKHGIKNVVLLAPAPPREIDWAFRNTIYPASFANGYLIDGLPDSESADVIKYGPHFSLPTHDWIGFFFMKPDGTISSKAPTPDDIVTFGYNSPVPLTATLQLTGLDVIGPPDPVYPYWKQDDFRLYNDLRPSINSGIFNTKMLQIVSYGQDTLISSYEGQMLYKYLTGSEKYDDNFIVVKGNKPHDAVHDLHISDPEYLLDSIRDMVRL